MSTKKTKVPQKIWTLEERKQIEDFLKKGIKSSKIASFFNVTMDQLQSEYKRGGGKDSYDPFLAHSRRALRCTDPKIFTENELQQISDMLKSGENLFNIRQKMRCGYEPLKRIIQEKFPESWADRNRSIKTALQRIEALEEQIKLIYDLMEEK